MEFNITIMDILKILAVVVVLIAIFAPKKNGYEYNRDKGRKYVYEVNVPKHYFPDDNPDKTPLSYWIEDADKLFENWIEFYVAK